MTNFIGFVVITLGLCVLAYFKVPKFKEFVDSKFKKPAQNAVDVIRAPFLASDNDVATPVPTPVQKPAVEPVLKPETPIYAPSTDAYRVKPNSPEQAALDSRGQGQFGPLPPPVEVPVGAIVAVTPGVRIEVRMKKDQKLRVSVVGNRKSLVVTGSEGGYDAAFNTSPDFTGVAFGAGTFYTDAAGYVEIYASKDCKVYLE